MTSQNPMTVNRANEIQHLRMLLQEVIQETFKPEDFMVAVQAEVDAAVRAERERCAEIANDCSCGYDHDVCDASPCCHSCCGYGIGNAIRLSKLESEK